MKNCIDHITIFEHQPIKLHQIIGGVNFNAEKLNALQSYYGEKGVPYFSLIHKGVRFNEYVGVIQIGNTVYEILPKADNLFSGKDEKNQWRDILIDMLHVVGVFDIHAPSSSSLKVKTNSILDLYFALFIKEVEYLLHTGLVKQYHKKEGNVKALKGSLQFAEHLQQNLTHQEQFYVRYTTYDVEHKLHHILYKTIKLLKQINLNADLHGSIGALLLHFPEMPDLKITEATFEKLVFNRKTQSYKKAIDIAKLLLLHYHPDVRSGRNNVLALMFDMNMLWEQFVYKSLRKHLKPNNTITAQTSKYFWKPESGYNSKIRPDIVVNKDSDDCVVVDTKWKNLNDCNPTLDDLRQLYVYHEYYGAKRVALVYPGRSNKDVKGRYFPTPSYTTMDKECSIILLAVPDKGVDNKGIVKTWQVEISKKFERWMELSKS